MLKNDDVEREIILQHLTQGVCKVFFRKVTNGRFRSIYCTLITSYIPLATRNGIENIFDPFPLDEDLLSVYDVVERTWKSFRLSNVIYFYDSNDLKESLTENRKKQAKQAKQEEQK